MITLTELRNDIYNEVGNVIATGQPIEVDYKGHIVKIIAADTPYKLSLFPSQKGIAGDPEDIIHNDFSGQSKLARLKPHPEAIVGDPEDLINIDWYAHSVLKPEYR